MRKLSALILLLGLCSAPAWSEQTDHDDAVRQVMRDIGIRYLVSDDRKLPKADRAKWEAGLASAVDFGSLNEGMRARVRTALKALADDDFDSEVTARLADKAVLFMVPRELSDSTILYLRVRENGGPLESCSESLRPVSDEPLALCLDTLSATRASVNFVGADGAVVRALVFVFSDRWRLANIEGEISEDTLGLIGRWK